MTKPKILFAVVALFFAATGAADAAFTLSSSVTNLTDNGVAVAVVTPIAPGTLIVLNGGASVTATNGGSSFVDSAGSTVYLLNDVQTGNTFATINEQLFVSAPTGVTDNDFINFTTLIKPTGSASSFSLTLGMNLVGTTGFQFAITPTQFTLLGPLSTSVSPPQIGSPGQVITNVSSSATSGNANSSQNPSIAATFTSSAIPEPASIAMLGLGLIGVGGVAFRRRASK
jgi:hypothetical protein